MCKITLAVDRIDKKGVADFPTVVLFGKQAENAEKFICKGCRVIVRGRIQTGKYDDKDGRTVYTTEVVADQVEYIDFKQKDGEAKAEVKKEDPPLFAMINEEIPF